MTRINREQFRNEFQSGIDINSLSEETKAALEKAGITKKKLVEIAHGDGKISGAELDRLFNAIDKFDNKRLDGYVDTYLYNPADGGGRIEGGDEPILTATGNAYEALKSDFERNRATAQITGVAPGGGHIEDAEESVQKRRPLPQKSSGSVPRKTPHEIDIAYYRSLWGNKEASELDKIMSKNPLEIQRLLEDPYMPVDLKAKVLSVALLRGESAPKGMEVPYEGIKAKYQKMAVDALLSDNGKLFEQLSSNDGGEHLPSHRRPATQLMHIMLQEGGWRSDYNGQNKIQAWIESLPSNIAGRAMYHMFDAAKSKDYGGSFKITGIGVEVGEVGFSFQGEYADTHWAEVTQNISDGVGDVLGSRSPEERRLIYEGFRDANRSFGTVIVDN